MEKIVLNGITWGHSRGIVPLFAASQRFNEMHPHIHVNWKKRTLQEFADFPIDKLTAVYDLLVIDHPWVGAAYNGNYVLPLDDHLTEHYLKTQSNHTVGYSHSSYEYGGRQWALAIDAAAPVASFRKDLFDKHSREVPDTWSDLLELAAQGKVLLPGIAIDTLMAFYSFCIAYGHHPFTDTKKQKVVDDDIGIKALHTMKSLWDLCDRRIFECNPIAVAELMTLADDYWYCPFSYGYSNYSRDSYAKNLLTYTETIRFGAFGRLKTTLGGTGLAISSSCKHQTEALDFVQWIAGVAIQTGLYTANGGQPANRNAWLDKTNNIITNNYFVNTLATIDNAFVRPRYDGYLHFQDFAGDPIKLYLKDGGDAKEVLNAINVLYTKSIKHANE